MRPLCTRAWVYHVCVVSLSHQGCSSDDNGQLTSSGGVIARFPMSPVKDGDPLWEPEPIFEAPVRHPIASPTPSVREYPAPVVEELDLSVFRRYLDIMARFERDFSPYYSAPDDGQPCPPSEYLELSSGGPVKLQPASALDPLVCEAVDESTRESLVVRTIPRDQEALWKAELRGYAFATAARPLQIAPIPIALNPVSLSPQCLSRTLVTDRTVGSPLSSLNLAHSLATLLDVAIAMIEEVQRVHRLGFIHGSISETAFVVDRSRKLRMVDFHRAQPFVDAHGVPFKDPKDCTDYFFVQRGDFLSPNELAHSWQQPTSVVRGATRTRGDDMFRIAETLLRLGGWTAEYDEEVAALQEFYRDVLPESGLAILDPTHKDYRELSTYMAELGNMKTRRVFAPETPPVFVTLYTECAQLGFAQVPPYKEWTDMLENEILKMEDTESTSEFST